MRQQFAFVASLAQLLLLWRYPLTITTVQAAVSGNAASTTVPSLPSEDRSYVSSLPHVLSQDSVEAFWKDLDALSTLKGVDLITPTHSKRDSSYTKSWSNTDWQLHQANSFVRYRRHVRSWIVSPTARALLPSVGAIVAWAALVVLISCHTRVGSYLRNSVAFSTSSFTTPIALLLTLRTNRSLDRLFEARGQWGVAMRAVTSLAGMSAIKHGGRHGPPENNTMDTTTSMDHYKEQVPILMGRYLALYAWSLKGFFLSEDDLAVIRHLLPPTEAHWLTTTNSSDRPTAIIFRLRSLLDQLFLSTAKRTAFEAKLGDLESSSGICKRILGSPIPPTYTRHLSRVLVLYLTLLPISLVSTGASPLSVLLNVALTAYVSMGLEEISVEIEHPFPLLPMYHLCSALERTVANQFRLSEALPSF